jgi:hypothetical protein
VTLQRRPVADPVRQVAAEDAQLDLGHVQPGAVLWRVVDFEPIGDALGLLGRKRLIATPRRRKPSSTRCLARLERWPAARRR